LTANQSHLFSRKFNGKIWKTIPNTASEFLAIEVRNEDNHQVTFYILDIMQRIWLWEDVTFEEQWWINLHSFGDQELAFIYYEDGNSPDQKQMLKIDIHSQKVLGDTEGSNEQKMIGNDVIPPLHYLANTAHFITVAKFLQEKLNISPVKAVDYLERDGHIVISYYIWINDHLANFLLILDENGEVQRHELLANQLSSIGIDTFFIIRDALFTIRQKSELLIYDF